MKRFLLTIAFLFVAFSMFSQAKLGYTEQQIKNFSPNNEFTNGYANDGSPYIFTSFDGMLVAYYFDDYGYSETVQIIVYKQGTLNYLVEKYNNQYVIISTTEWRMYSDGGVMQIKLVFNDNDTQSFWFTNLN